MNTEVNYPSYPEYMYLVQLENAWRINSPEGWLTPTLGVTITYRSNVCHGQLYMDCPIGGFIEEISILEFLISTGKNPLGAFNE